jgi:cAMP phosphodiesterase
MNCNEINISLLSDDIFHQNYPIDFLNFCKINNIKLPSINTGSGKALLIMVLYPNKYFTRTTTDLFCNKFNIKTADSIQLFNKHEQRGLKMSKIKGKYYIIYPYQVSHKAKMRKNFNKILSNNEKNIEINNIKEYITENYINIPNDKWEFGHKNPEDIDNTMKNLVLQPPIQGKYRDRYIFIDTLTKIPTPKELQRLYNNNNSPYTKKQLQELKNWLINI